MLIDYPYIHAYGNVLCWSKEKIAGEIAKAQQADAPSDVVRILPNGRWTRYKDYDTDWQKRLDPKPAENKI